MRVIVASSRPLEESNMSAWRHVLGTGEGVFHTLLTWRPLRYLGRISYTFYLYHVAVLVIVSHYLHTSDCVELHEPVQFEPPPPLPPEVVDRTRNTYVAAYERITGLRWRS